ncbi:HAMP domain-containing histidine kinase [Aquisphaera insulae]|uniref:HAMP domain-containing histidine kinase n=1 Tax=Aquisphaera insulae TaxID=2712864 RepID=UPI0013EB226D|nr:HAMP domain-containing histidine kinase [Aquisphaera insulae]
MTRLVQDERHVDQLRESLSGFSHRCRNLLNGMKMSLYFVRRAGADSLPSWWDDMEASYGGMEQLFEHLQAIYRPMPLSTIDARVGVLLRDLGATWRQRFASSGRSLELCPPAEEAVLPFDPMRLSMGLEAFLSWRSVAMPPDRRGRLEWRTEKGRFQACWHEAGSLEPPTEPGWAEAGPEPDSPATGPLALALPLLTRVVAAHRGKLRWSRSPGLRVEFGWPIGAAVEPTSTSEAAGRSPLTAGHGSA